jgi:tetratricopeptide (TPR) repeat protein
VTALPSPSEPERFLAEARRLAAREAWPELARACDEGWHPEWVTEFPELAVLRAESELRVGAPQAARSCLLLGIPVLERRADAANLRRAINLLGAAHFELGDLADAEAAFQRALELANLDGDHLLIARATNNLGSIVNIRAQHEAALAFYQLAIPAYQRLGSALGLATTHHNMAITYRDIDQLDEADRCELRAIEFAREAGSVQLLAVARAGRAELALRKGDARTAEAGARLAVSEYAGIPDPVGEADALRIVGSARTAAGEPDRALQALDRAVELATTHASALIEAECRRGRAEAYGALGRLPEARTDAAASIAVFERLGATADAAALHAWVARLGQSGPI